MDAGCVMLQCFRPALLGAASEFSLLPSPGERIAIRLVIYAGALALLGAATFAFNALPAHRRSLCKAALLLGFTLVIPFVACVWTGNAENMGASAPLILTAAGTGSLLVFFGYMLLKKINSEGDGEEQI